MIVDKKFISDMDKLRKPKKGSGLFDACSKSVIVFSDKMLGVRLYAWQVKFLSKCMERLGNPDLEREILAMTSRQIGKSTAIAIFSLWCCVFNKASGTVSNNTSVGITSASDVQAKKLLYEMKKLIRLGDRFIADQYLDNDNKPMFGDELLSSLLDEHEPNNTTTITFKSYNEDMHGEYLLYGSKAGSTIKSYPPTSSILGETFSVVIIDEAGKTDKISDQFFYDYIYPTGNSTNAIRIYTSTPWVSSGFFYRLVNPDNVYNDSPSCVLIFTIDAIEIENKKYYDVVMKTVKSLNDDGKTGEVQRAYYCRFVKGEQSYFNPEKVFNIFKKELFMLNDLVTPCDMGIDFGGKVKSRTVITISQLTEEGIAERVYHRSYEVGEDEYLIEDVVDLMKQFNVQRVIVDECPAGQYLIPKMKDKGWEVIPMNFRSEKVKKYGAFRSWINKGKIHSYEDDELKTEMLAMENTPSSRQSVIQAAQGYNDDLIDSFVMSTYFFVEDETGIEFYEWEDN